MKKIVIIDDEYFFRQALIKYVRNFKDEFTVVGDAGNGKLGIELIEQYHPEIILIDINMPQMTGFDVISYIYRNKRFKPVLLLFPVMTSLSMRKKPFRWACRIFY